MDMAAFFEVHKNIYRQGPGLPEDVHWALAEAGLSGLLGVLDAGCGPGADLVTLADALTEAQITGIEMHAGFVDEARVRTADYGDRVDIQLGNMADPGGPYDLIWCAGALYFIGVTEGLTAWRQALKPGGWVAFSEPVRLPGAPSPEEEAFWSDEGYVVGDLAEISERVQAADFRVQSHRLIIGPAWEAYYGPLRARVAKLRAMGDSSLTEALDATAREIALWEVVPDRIAYVLMLVHLA